ncbi:P-loop containing nucleoside triphosphate hydrolase protein [Baffinella frigidus]|nr:P-loop containing nucleoside triphosphate hydrolase protein [Cryptophyta sp. CCMP2293]
MTNLITWAPKTDELEKSIREKQKSLETDQEAYHKITDEVFKDFCKELKIANIVEYEGGTLKEQRDRTDRLNQLAKQVAMLKGKIDKDKTSEESLRKKVESFKTGMAKDQKEMEAFSAKVEASKKKLKDAMEAKAEEKRKRDQVMDDIDEIEKQLREVQAVLKKTHDDRDGAAKLVERAESLMEKLSAQRTSLLEQSELDEVELPKRKGAGAGEEEDAEMEEGDDAMEVDDSAGHSQPAKRVKKAIAEARLDYSKVPREQKRDMPDKEKKRVLEDLEEKQKKIAESLGTMNPNMKAFEQLKEIEARYEEVQGEMQAAKQKSQDLTKSFDEVRKKRCEMFNACFDHVKSCIDKIYKELTSDPTKAEQSVGGSAYLTLNNQDEPYLDGIKYDTIPPGKRFMDMTHLSGGEKPMAVSVAMKVSLGSDQGEKTVAALALLFAINSYFPAPFIVLDEVDAALDSRNVAKVPPAT